MRRSCLAAVGLFVAGAVVGFLLRAPFTEPGRLASGSAVTSPTPAATMPDALGGSTLIVPPATQPFATPLTISPGAMPTERPSGAPLTNPVTVTTPPASPSPSLP